MEAKCGWEEADLLRVSLPLTAGMTHTALRVDAIQQTSFPFFTSKCWQIVWIALKTLGSDGNNPYQVVLAALDIKDAFLQVPQEKLVMVSLCNQQYVIRRNLPGQRLGAKAWYWYFRKYISETLNCSWCVEQPCLAKCTPDGISNCFLIHVDDLLFAGSRDFRNNQFLPAVISKFNVSFSEIKDDSSSIFFLKRQLLLKLSDGLLIVPGTTTGKIVAYFEKFFGVARN